MSYDVGIGDHSFNYTSNCSSLWYDHIPDNGKGGGLHEINGLTGKRAVTILNDAFQRMNSTRYSLWESNAVGEPAMSAKYDSPNGWGSMIGAIIFLAQIMGACALNPRSKVWVSA